MLGMANHFKSHFVGYLLLKFLPDGQTLSIRSESLERP